MKRTKIAAVVTILVVGATMMLPAGNNIVYADEIKEVQQINKIAKVNYIDRETSESILTTTTLEEYDFSDNDSVTFVDRYMYGSINHIANIDGYKFDYYEYNGEKIYSGDAFIKLTEENREINAVYTKKDVTKNKLHNNNAVITLDYLNSCIETGKDLYVSIDGGAMFISLPANYVKEILNTVKNKENDFEKFLTLGADVVNLKDSEIKELKEKYGFLYGVNTRSNVNLDKNLKYKLNYISGQDSDSAMTGTVSLYGKDKDGKIVKLDSQKEKDSISTGFELKDNIFKYDYIFVGLDGYMGVDSDKKEDSKKEEFLADKNEINDDEIVNENNKEDNLENNKEENKIEDNIEDSLEKNNESVDKELTEDKVEEEKKDSNILILLATLIGGMAAGMGIHKLTGLKKEK